MLVVMNRLAVPAVEVQEAHRVRFAFDHRKIAGPVENRFRFEACQGLAYFAVITPEQTGRRQCPNLAARRSGSRLQMVLLQLRRPSGTMLETRSTRHGFDGESESDTKVLRGNYLQDETLRAVHNPQQLDWRLAVLQPFAYNSLGIRSCSHSKDNSVDHRRRKST